MWRAKGAPCYIGPVGGGLCWKTPNLGRKVPRLSRFRDQTSERFPEHPTVPFSKTRNQPHHAILHAHHWGYLKIAPSEESISLSLPMFYVVPHVYLEKLWVSRRIL